MTLRRQKFIFDVHIPSYVQRGKIARSDWESVLKYMSSRASYAITSITLYELIAGIDGGDDAHFPDNRDRLKVLCEPDGREFLPLASDFVRSTVFGLPIRAQAFESDKLKVWVEVILNAPTKADLLAGNVFVRGQSYGSDIAPLVDHVRQGKQLDVKRLEKLRHNSRGVWSTEMWLAAYEAWHVAVLKRMSLPSTPENIDEVKDRLDAAWCYDRERYRLAKYTNYDFPSHDSDWLDWQLLYYLADPQIHLVTYDSRLKKRVKNSTQSSRILHFSDLLAIAKSPKA